MREGLAVHRRGTGKGTGLSDPLHKIVDADAGLDRAALLALPEEERRPALEAWLRAGAAKALGVPASLQAADRPLTAPGPPSPRSCRRPVRARPRRAGRPPRPCATSSTPGASSSTDEPPGPADLPASCHPSCLGLPLVLGLRRLAFRFGILGLRLVRGGGVEGARSGGAHRELVGPGPLCRNRIHQ